MPLRMQRGVFKAHTSLCQTCCAVTGAVRALSSITPAAHIGPESPRFIDVPQPLQPRYPPRQAIKGILPVPRNVFRARRGLDKTSPEWIAAATPEPSSTTEEWKLSQEPKERADLIVWKEKMAAIRRRNLREGLVELKYRKQRMDREVAQRSAAIRAKHDRAARQEKREDEKLTDPTIPVPMKQFGKGIVPDPDRIARLETKRAMFEARELGKRENRKDALHSLYMNAGNFITTEEQLQAAVDAAFTTEANKTWYNAASPTSEAESVWNIGAPDTMSMMLSKVNKTGGRAMEYNAGHATVTGDRIRKIAEELTGGRI